MKKNKLDDFYKMQIKDAALLRAIQFNEYNEISLEKLLEDAEKIHKFYSENKNKNNVVKLKQVNDNGNS